jgi:hypothetical protein
MTTAVAAPLALLLGLTASVACANTPLTVTNTLDSGPGSLRQAIINANSASGSDTIAFNIDANSDAGCNSTTKVCTIKPASLFDNITSQLTIDGYSQTGSSPNTLLVGDDAKLLIELDATNVSPAFRLEGPTILGSTIKGLAITHLAGVGILITDGSGNNTIAGNFIGVNVSATASSFVGTAFAVDVESASNANTIGGTTPAARNVLSGNGTIITVSGCNNAVIQGNYINIDKDGAVPLVAALRGIDVGAGSGNLIGSSAPGAGNVIGTWAAIAIIFQGSGNNNLIQGNRIGTDATGTTLLGGGFEGVNYYEGSGTGNKIGGAAAGEGNLINGATNGDGFGLVLYFDTSPDLVVQGNLIGTDITGELPLGNLNGISAQDVSAGLIGGTAAGAGNRIAFNSSLGVSVTYSNSVVAILGNDIYANGSLGISLSGGGVPTPNDDGDADTGPNNLQNYPVITTVTVSPKTMVHVSGSLNSEANKTYRLEFFANASCDSSHNGEGKIFLGHADAGTSPNDVAFGPLDFAVPADRHVITATATDPSGNTSEFSVCSTQDTIFSDGFEAD